MSTRPRVRWWQTVVASIAVLVLGLVGIVVGTVGLLTSPELYRSSSDGALPDWTEDVASSWSDYNEGVPETEPAWTTDEFVAAVGDGSPGRIVWMPGAATYLDTAAIDAMIAGSDVLVVVTPPSPLGAIETTRVRDNTVQKYWADERGVRLVMVHGTEAYLPYSDALGGLIVGATPGAGLPTRDALLYGDATGAVQYAIDAYRGADSPAPAAFDTSAAALRPEGRAPSDAELAPVVAALESGTPYLAPGVAGPLDVDLSGLGDDVRVAVFPTVVPGEYVDYAAALAAAFPGDSVVAVTGNWVQTAGLDDQLATDVMLQISGIGGFPLAAATPDPGRLLSLFASTYEVAAAGIAAHDGLPSAAEGMPRWVAYLVLGVSVVLVLGFLAGSLLEWRGRRTESWQQRRDRLAGLLAERYVAIGSALALSLRADTAAARRELDAAYSALLELRGADEGAADEAALAAWESLDAAPRAIGHGELGPSATLDAADRPRPEAVAPQAAAGRSRGATGRRQGRRWLWWVVALIAGPFLAINVLGRLAGPLSLDETEGGELREALSSGSAAAGAGTDVDLAGVRETIGTRSLMLVYDTGAGSSAYSLGESIVAEHPQAVVFVIVDGKIDTAKIGSDAAALGYDVYALIEDYYPMQYVAGSDPVAQARQLAILYDRLVAEGKVNGIERLQYESPIPWVPVGIGMVVALVIAAFLVRAATLRVARWRAERDDETGERESLAMRLAETSTQLLHTNGVPSDVLAGFARREAALAAEIAAVDPPGFAGLRARIEAFDDEVGRALA